MGACDEYINVNKDLNIDQAIKAFRGMIKEMRAYNGHREGYSGDFQTNSGLDCRFNTVFNTYNEAYDYCVNNARKWEDVLAVKYKSLDGVKKTKRLITLTQRLDKEIVALDDLLKQIKTNLKNAKSKTIGCKKCDSKLNRQYIAGFRCPLCGGELRSDTDIKRILSNEKRIKTIKKQIKEEEVKMNKKGKINTLFYGVCAC